MKLKRFHFSLFFLFCTSYNDDGGWIMPRSKYEDIYRSIREDIMRGKYSCGDYLPSENEYVNHFGCTRNTVRRALAMLEQEGIVLPQHGKGVQVIWQKDEGNVFTIGGIESFAETTHRNARKVKTRVAVFKEIICDHAMSLNTGFDEGSVLYYIERVRTFDGRAMIFDTNCFLKSETPGLTKEIAGKSVYDYLENSLGMSITASRRRITAESANNRDREYLDLHGKDFVLCVSGQVFNAKGTMFEYTQSRHVPDGVCFVETAVRQKI